MVRGQPPHESALPYPATPMTGRDVMPSGGIYVQQGSSPGPPPPAGSHGGPHPGLYPRENYAALSAPYVAYSKAASSGGAPVTIVAQVIPSSILKDNQEQVVCQHCHQTVVPKAMHSCGKLTCMLCLGLFVFGCVVCSCLPFFFDSCKDLDHRCPSCDEIICTYRRQINGFYVRQMFF